MKQLYALMAKAPPGGWNVSSEEKSGTAAGFGDFKDEKLIRAVRNCIRNAFIKIRGGNR